jgi:hypothetical protein
MRPGASIFLAVWMFSAIGCALAAQADPPAAGKGPYLGQKPPGMTAEVFAPGLVSSSAFEHSRLEIAKDGTALYWVVQPTRGKQLIWTTQRGPDGIWSPPAPLPIANGAEELPFLHSPTLAPDGETLYFSSIDWGDESEHGPARPPSFYAVDLKNPRWNAPTPIQPWFPDPGSVWAYSFDANGDLYFDSDFKLFSMTRRGDRYDPPVPLGNGTVAGQEDFIPFVAPDESYVIYSSVRSGSVGGSIDLYVSFRGADGDWGAARNLGPAVNTAANERFPTVSPDGKYFFFLRNDPQGDSSFYWIDAAIIETAK